MKEDINLYDTSDYDENNIYILPLVNKKKVIGKMKDENKGNIMTEYVGLKSKICRKKQFNSPPQLENQSQCRRKTTQLVSRNENSTQQEKTTQLSSRNEQLNSAAGMKQPNSPVGTKRLNSSVGTKQLNSALPSTAYNRLQPPATACNHLQPPTTAYNRLQPPATACTACTTFTAELAFSTY
ncbi:hypothetical protein TNCV_3714221 [Trichonephila clavipes]|nr:hypothetical protein TNCV_3714221 [Trichonephila clavipes]